MHKLTVSHFPPYQLVDKRTFSLPGNVKPALTAKHTLHSSILIAIGLRQSGSAYHWLLLS